MKKFVFDNKILILVILLGFFLRICQVSLMPPSLNWDEVSHGYNAYSIIKNGTDEWGVSFPLIFRAFGDYKLPVYIYATAASEIFFGLSAFAVRFPSVLSGVVSIVFMYLLTRKLFKEEKVALITAFLMAISPWDLFLSRIAVEANLALALIISGIYFLVSGIEKKNKTLILGVFLLSLSVWTYNSARVFVPLILVAYLIIYRKELMKNFSVSKVHILISGFLVALFFIPMFYQLVHTEGSARYENVQILDQGAIAQINDLRQKTNMPDAVERVLFNKVTYFGESFAINYIKHFSPSFLFFSGGDNYQFNVQGFGLLYIVNLPIFAYGFFLLLSKARKKKTVQVLFVWLLLSPVAASITRESPHTLRSIMMVAPVIIITGYGVIKLSKKFDSKYFLGAYILILIISFVSYWNIYWGGYRKDYSFAWQYGYKQVANIIKDKYQNYEKIVISKKYGEPHEFLLFYLAIDPHKYIADPNLIRYFKSNWYWEDRFDKFYFVNDWDIPKTSSHFVLESGGEFDCASCLLFTSPGNAPEGWRKIDEIDFLSGENAFDVYEH